MCFFRFQSVKVSLGICLILLGEWVFSFSWFFVVIFSGAQAEFCNFSIFMHCPSAQLGRFWRREPFRHLGLDRWQFHSGSLIFVYFALLKLLIKCRLLEYFRRLSEHTAVPWSLVISSTEEASGLDLLHCFGHVVGTTSGNFIYFFCCGRFLVHLQ